MNGAVTYQQLLREGQQQLFEGGVQEAAADAWYLMSDVFGIDRAWFYMQGTLPVEDEERCSRFRELVRRRCEGIPVQYLTGKAAFMGFEFEVTPAVLIPRQDTETLVETALAKISGPARVLDMCTGSGCIILSLAAMKPEVTGCGADLSAEALAVAGRNRERLGVADRVELIRSDLFQQIEGMYDMILSNPPYIRSEEIDTLMTEVRDHEPRMALDGGADGLDYYRMLASQAGAHLAEGGWLIMEIGYDQAADVTQLLLNEDYKEITVVKDLPGLDRVVCGRK